ncbi:hypothetical protein DRQ00_06230 [candidate division KSB1 bacterium]|nr:MAG: hypothetical protein DRQ00_06230 [candidate division KSB1 bacterium]
MPLDTHFFGDKMRKFSGLILVGLLITISSATTGAPKELGILYGQWQPLNLTTQTTASLFQGIADTSPYFALFFNTHIAKGIYLQQTIGFWNQKKVKILWIQSVLIIPFYLNIKHRLVEKSPLSPFVSYGAGLLLGIENHQTGTIPTTNTETTQATQLGFEFNISTGIDVTICRHLGLNLSFCYCYAKFPQKLGETDDYTGSRATVGIFYVF